LGLFVANAALIRHLHGITYEVVCSSSRCVPWTPWAFEVELASIDLKPALGGAL